jgi:type IV pilus assembly protein PilY1
MDGYIDKVYIGDRGAQMWVFGVSDTDTTKWTGKRLFKAPQENPEKHSIYSQPAVAFDNYGLPWVFFGTGDREDPKAKTHTERFYAVVDDGKGTYPRTEGYLSDRSLDVNNTYQAAYNPNTPETKRGWYIKLDKKPGEKVLAKPSVFNRLVYFTTYTPEGKKEPEETCNEGGTGKLFIVEYLSGGGAVVEDDEVEFFDARYKSGLGTPSARSKVTGIGTLSAPVITVNLKGQAVVISGTLTGQVYSATAFSPGTSKQTSYWREVTR